MIWWRKKKGRALAVGLLPHVLHWIAYATPQAVDGKQCQWSGYKLVAGRSVRKYTSEAETLKAATEAGYTDIYKTLGIGELERRMGKKKFADVLGKYVAKPAGAPTPVREADPRKPYSDATSDFLKE